MDHDDASLVGHGGSDAGGARAWSETAATPRRDEEEASGGGCRRAATMARDRAGRAAESAGSREPPARRARGRGGARATTVSGGGRRRSATRDAGSVGGPCRPGRGAARTPGSRKCPASSRMRRRARHRPRERSQADAPPGRAPAGRGAPGRAGRGARSRADEPPRVQGRASVTGDPRGGSRATGIVEQVRRATLPRHAATPHRRERGRRGRTASSNGRPSPFSFPLPR